MKNSSSVCFIVIGMVTAAGLTTLTARDGWKVWRPVAATLAMWLRLRHSNQ